FIAAAAVTVIAYRFFGSRLVVDTPPPQGADSLSNPEALFPLGIAVLSLITFLVYARWRNGIGAAFLVTVIFADLLFFGVAFNWGWRDFVRDTSARLQDPPAVRFIKSREPDLNTFRTITGGPSPYGVSYFALNAPNISIARGLQSVNGYDALRLSRQSAISGDMGS